MGANIEIKARIRNWARQRAEARLIADGEGELLEQVDTFFAVPAGRLKLRQLGDQRGELIFYERPNVPGPKLCEYSITPTTAPAQLCETLARALGICAEVRKRRTLFLSTKWEGRTRIHLDEVKGLGQFIELEVVLAPGQPPEAGEQVAEKFRTALDIRDADLIDCAYVDLITTRGCGP
ncbi:MAG: class IV adenylate cyclase [Paracoccaceae bacterium]